MPHEIFDKKLEILDTDITFEQIYQKDYVPKEYLEEIKKANLLIIPNENFREKGDVLFPETTQDFFEFVKDSADDDVIADIAISDEDFQRIELHSAVIEFATIIVKSSIFNIAIGLITSFLYDLIKKYHRTPEDTSTKLKIITKETKSQKSKMIIYKGPVAGAKEALEQAAKNIFVESQNDDD